MIMHLQKTWNYRSGMATTACGKEIQRPEYSSGLSKVGLTTVSTTVDCHECLKPIVAKLRENLAILEARLQMPQQAATASANKSRAEGMAEL